MMRHGLAILVVVILVGCEDRKRSSLDRRGLAAVTSDFSVSRNTGPTTAAPAAITELEGQIRGKPFRPDQIMLDGNTLRFVKGSEYSAEQELRFDLPVPEGERLNGREWKIGGRFGEPSLSLTSRSGGMPDYALVGGHEYELKVRFTKQSPTDVEGTIDIQFKYWEKTWLRGPFTAKYRKSATANLDENDAPFVQGKITLKGNDRMWDVTVGFVGIGSDGAPHSNSAGFPLMVGQGASVTNSMQAPQITSLNNHLTAGLIYRHTKMPPGDYLVYLRRGEVMFAWERIKLKPSDQVKVEFTIDLQKAGEVKFELPVNNAKADQPLALVMVPAGVDIPDLGLEGHLFFTVARVKSGVTAVTVGGVPAGKYRAIFDKAEANVEVATGKSVVVTFLPAK